MTEQGERRMTDSQRLFRKTTDRRENCQPRSERTRVKQEQDSSDSLFILLIFGLFSSVLKFVTCFERYDPT